MTRTPHAPTTSTSRLFSAALASLACVLAACNQTPKAPPDVLALPDDPRADVFPGRPLIVTINSGDVKFLKGSNNLDAFIGGIGPVEATLHRVIITTPESNEPTDAWLPRRNIWRSVPVTQQTFDPSARGTLVAVVTMPDRPLGDAIQIGERKLVLNYLPEVGALPAGVEDPFRPAAGESAITNLSLVTRARAEGTSPVTRWRYHLLIDGLSPGVTTGPSATLQPASFEDAVVEGIARQNETRWRLALTSLFAHDADLAARVKRRLAAVVDFGNGQLTPAWPTDHVSMDRLLLDLLDPTISPARRAERAERWLDEQPPAIAWVVDDAGTLNEARTVAMPTIGLANLSDRATLAWAGPRDSADPQLRTIPSYSATSIVTLPPRTDSTTANIPTGVGRWSDQVETASSVLPIRPPGLTIAPFAGDLTMRDWLSGQVVLPRVEWSTGALLHRPAPGATVPGGQSRRWELLVECRVPETHTNLTGDSVQVWFGAFGSPNRVLSISSDGTVTDLHAPRDDAAQVLEHSATIPITRLKDRWTFRLALPPGALERDGILRVGMFRTDAQARRSAWPRPMLPWQTEPARAALNTRAWSGLDEAGLDESALDAATNSSGGPSDESFNPR